MRLTFIIVAIAAAVLIIGAIKYVPAWIGTQPEVEAQPGPAAVEPVMLPQSKPPEPAPVDPLPEPVIELPPLEASDAFVRGELESWSLPEVWLARDDLVRRLATVLSNASVGEYPSRQLAFLAPSGPFRVIERDAKTFIDPAGYDRFDRYLDILESIDPETAVSLLELLEPLLGEALAELGDLTPVDETLRNAIDLLIDVPILDGDVEVVQPNVFYEYADAGLEARSPLEKQVLRMGPANVARLKTYLTRLRAAL